MSVENTNVKCRIQQCPGEIVLETCQEYLGDPKQAIMGPGYKNQFTTIVVLYCSHCGVQYHKLPKLPT